MWKLGRQGGEYLKFKLAEMSWPIPFDLYILKFPTGSEVKLHRDPVKEGYEHHRLNIVVKKADRGGSFWTYENRFKLVKTRFWKLRPDIVEHEMRPVKAGTMYLLSIGWLKKRG